MALRVAVTKYSKLGVFKQQTCIPSQFWSQCGKSSCWLSSFLLRALKENLSHAFLPAPGEGCRSWCPLACSYVTRISDSIFMWHFMVVLERRPILLHVNNYICNYPISKQGHVLGYWGLGLHHIFLGRHGSTHNRRIWPSGHREKN